MRRARALGLGVPLENEDARRDWEASKSMGQQRWGLGTEHGAKTDAHRRLLLQM